MSASSELKEIVSGIIESYLVPSYSLMQVNFNGYIKVRHRNEHKEEDGRFEVFQFENGLWKFAGQARSEYQAVSIVVHRFKNFNEKADLTPGGEGRTPVCSVTNENEITATYSPFGNKDEQRSAFAEYFETIKETKVVPSMA